MPGVKSNRPETTVFPDDVFGRLVKAGDSVLMEVYQGRFRGVISARFQCYKDREIRSSYPTYEGHPVPLRRGSEIRVTAVTPEGLAIVDGTVERVEKTDDPVLVVRVNDDAEVQLSQQRRFVRADTTVPFVYQRWIGGQRTQAIEAETQDLSGSGLSFLSDAEIQPNERLEIRLDLPDQGEVRTLGRVIKSEPIDGKKKRKKTYLVAVNFSEILLADQDAIVHYIFQVERSMGDPNELLLS